jgi:hypothetical protein
VGGNEEAAVTGFQHCLRRSLIKKVGVRRFRFPSLDSSVLYVQSPHEMSCIFLVLPPACICS